MIFISNVKNIKKHKKKKSQTPETTCSHHSWKKNSILCSCNFKSLPSMLLLLLGPYKATRLCMHIKPELQVNLVFLKTIKTLISGLIR